MLRPQLLACALAGCLVLVGPAALAQSTAATVRGQVTVDAQPLAAASITATNTATGFTRTVVADATGGYSLVGLPPGTYRIDAADAERSVSQTVTLRVGQTATLDLPMPSAVPEQTMEAVESVGKLLFENKTSEVATYVTPEQIAALPQNSRNFLAFADIVPGMQLETRADGSTQLRSGAQSSNGINVFIDGVGQKNYVLKGGISSQDSTRGSPFPQLAIAEYKVISQNYKAEFDQLSSAAVTALTRSGTNEFEGSIFYDRTTDDWRASTPRELSSGVKAESQDEQYGVSFGGPIVKDLLHFFVSYEAKEIVSPREVNPGENVPVSALPANLAAQVGPTSSPFDMDLFFGKLSWAPGDDHLVEFSVKYRQESELTGIGGVNTPSYGSSKDNDETRIDLHHQFSGETFLNDAHINFEDAFWNPRSLTEGPGYRLVTPDRRTILNAGGGRDYQDKGQRGIGLQDDLTFFDIDWHGNHTVKMGAKYKSVRVESFEQQPFNPQFEYDITRSTTIPFLVEFGAVVPGIGDRAAASRNQQFGIYLQDDWEVNERLILNFGLRWDYEEIPGYLDHQTRPELAAALRNWTNIQNTDYDIENFISDGSNRDAFKDAWQPRVGFSYDVAGDEEHVVFGGAGRAYDRNLFDYLALERLKGTFPSYTFNFNTPGHPCTGATCLEWDPSYFDPDNLAALVAANPNLGGEVNMIANDLKTPYSDQFSIGMRNVLGDWNNSVTLSHIRSHDGIVFTLGNRYPDGSFRPQGTTWGGQPWGFPIPGYGTLILADNGIETRLNSLLVALDKPYTVESGWGVTIAYTFSDAEENRPNAASADEHYLFDYADVDQVGWKRSVGIARHRLVTTGIVSGWWDMVYSAKLTLESPSTYDAVNCFNASDFNHCFFDPLTPSGSFGRRQLDLAASKDWAFGDGYALNFRIDVLNVFNHRNWNEFDNWRGGPNEPNPGFGNRGEGIALPTRTVKLSMGFRW
jgi:outer membrane receptor protein involved in Fe transport